jgi:hypothetical protein
VNDGGPPPSTPRPPAPTPPSIERSVQEHLDVVHEMREFRAAIASLTTAVSRLVTTRTEDRLAIGSLEKRVTALEKKVDALLQNQLALMKHVGATPHA